MISNDNRFFENKMNTDNIPSNSNSILKPIMVTIVSSGEKLMSSIFENNGLIMKIVEEDLKKSA